MKKIPLPILIVADVAVFAVSLLVFAWFHHVRPVVMAPESPLDTPVLDFADWSEKFPGKFLPEGEVVSTDTQYIDSNVNITIQKKRYADSNVHIADVYVRDLSYLRSFFALDTYGRQITDSTLNISREHDAVFSVSGDYYGIRDRSVVIRNGAVYRTSKAHQICAMYLDGTMETFAFKDFNVSETIEKGAWQVWDFGPCLLDENSEPITEFSTGIAGKNPRIAIGYYEPGHYVFVATDGRQTASSGMTLIEMAEFFKSLGCKRAYNLDGGHSAVMVFKGEIINSPSAKGGRDISDIVGIVTDTYKTEGEAS